MKELDGRTIFSGKVSGEIIKSNQGISFFGGINPENGVVVEKGHDLEGKCISGKILVFPQGKGSTVGSYTLYRLKKSNLAPLAIINKKCETIVAVGCIISEIPCIDMVNIDEFKDNQKVEVDSIEGKVRILE